MKIKKQLKLHMKHSCEICKANTQQLKGGLHEMKYKQLAMAIVGLMLILSTFSSLTLVSSQSDDMQDEPNIWGEDKYEVKIEGFMGYNDPFSRRSWETMQQLHDEFGDRITFIWRNYPFEFNDAGYKVAQAGECVLSFSDKETFFKYTGYIMNLDQSERLNSDEAIELADELFDIDIRECVYSGKFLPEIQDDRSDGIKKGGGELGTPTFFIGTEQINGAQPYSVFQEIIMKQLGDDNGGGSGGGDEVVLHGNSFALNDDQTEGELVALSVGLTENKGYQGKFYFGKTGYRAEGGFEDETLYFRFYDVNSDKLIYTSYGELKKFNGFILYQGNLKPVDENDDDIWQMNIILQEGQGDDTEEGVAEDVKCVFHDSETEQQCYEAEEGEFGCTGIKGCVTRIEGEKGEKITWKSTCGGYAYTVMDGENEYAEFYCGSELPFPTERKVVFESRVDEVKTFRPEAKPIADVKNTPALTSSGEIDFQTSDTKEIKVTPVRIESQRALGIIPKFWSEEKRAVVEFNDGTKTSTVTINEGEAKQVEGYVIEVGKIDSEGKIPIAVSSSLSSK